MSYAPISEELRQEIDRALMGARLFCLWRVRECATVRLRLEQNGTGRRQDFREADDGELLEHVQRFAEVEIREVMRVSEPNYDEDED